VLTTKLHLSINVLREVLDFMVAEQVAEVAWRGDSDLDVQYQLTSAGKQRASAWLERCAYAGPAPVTLEAYRAMVERQATQAPQPCADELAAEFTDDFWRRRCSACWARPCMPAAACCCTGRPAAASRRWRGARRAAARTGGGAACDRGGQGYRAGVRPGRAPRAAAAPGARAQQERRSSDPRWVLCQRPWWRWMPRSMRTCWTCSPMPPAAAIARRRS
jgi:hypothetical protein